MITTPLYLVAVVTLGLLALRTSIVAITPFAFNKQHDDQAQSTGSAQACKTLSTCEAAVQKRAIEIAVFDDGNDRAFINDLSKQADRSPVDDAVIAASRKVGNIGLCNNKATGNALLIEYKGRPAVVTSAHFLIDKKAKRLKCDSWAMLKSNASYMPNASFFDSSNPTRNYSFVMKEVDLVFPPANFDDLSDLIISNANDMVIFYLTTDVSKDKLPDGSTRGFLKFSKQEPSQDNLYMIGISIDMNGAKDTVYQEKCGGYVFDGVLMHTCDANDFASGSLIATLEGNELTFLATHTAGVNNAVYKKEDIWNPARANVGTLASYISDQDGH